MGSLPRRRAAFALAGPLGPRIEGSLSKVVTLSPVGTACAAWGTAFFGVLVAGAIVLHLVRAPLDRARLGALDRPAGAFVGLVKGAVVLVVAAYVLLGWYAGVEGPAVVASLRESATARCARTLEERYRPFLRLPLLVQQRVDEVNAGIRPSDAP